MRIVSAADDMQAHPRKIAVNITFAKTIRFIVPFSEHCHYWETRYYAILSMTLWPFLGARWISLQRKQLLGIFVQYLFFRLVR